MQENWYFGMYGWSRGDMYGLSPPRGALRRLREESRHRAYLGESKKKSNQLQHHTTGGIKNPTHPRSPCLDYLPSWPDITDPTPSPPVPGASTPCVAKDEGRAGPSKEENRVRREVH